MFVYYDANEKACAVEFGKRAEIEYDGFRLFAYPAVEVRQWARQRDPSLDDRDGFISNSLGLAMWAPGLDDKYVEYPDDPADSIGVFRPGYYEEERKRLDEALRRER